MSDTLPPIAVAPAGSSELTLAAADAMYAKAGYSDDERAAAGYRTAGSAKSTAGKTASEQIVDPFINGKAASDPKFAAPPTAAGNLSYEEKVSAFQKLRGVVDDTTLAAAAKAEGVNPADLKIEAPAEPEKITLQEANERLAQTSGPFAASQSPNDFSFQFQPDHIDGLQPDEVADIHSMFASALHGASIPVQLGQSLFSEAMTAANLFDGMDPATAALKYAEEGSKLRRLGNIEQIKADGEYAWARLPKDFQEVATEHRLFHTASSYHALANAGAMMRLRDGKR